jgi:drug/metabolite transporter (DMT)-like permease
MLKKRRMRRVLALFLVVFGGVLIFLAPEVWVGVLLLVLGAAVELAGIALERRA